MYTSLIKVSISPGPHEINSWNWKCLYEKAGLAKKKGSISCTVRQHELKSSLKEQTKPNEIQRVWQKLYYCLQQQQPIPKTAHFLISRSKIVKKRVHKVKDAISEEILYHCKGTWNRIIQPKDFIAAPPPPEGANSSWVRGFEFMAHPCRKLACGVWRAASVRQKQELYISSWGTEGHMDLA